MSVEGLQKLADELIGSSNPPFKTFGERMREELVGVQDVPPVEEEKVFSQEDLDATLAQEEAPLSEEPPTGIEETGQVPDTSPTIRDNRDTYPH